MNVFTTTEFARIGMVSARMLRCYESTGRLRPRRIDPATGRGGDQASQLPRLNRILALNDLGFTLPQVWAILGTSFEALARWIDTNGCTSTGLVREVFPDRPDDAPEQWVTELQVPVRSC